MVEARIHVILAYLFFFLIFNRIAEPVFAYYLRISCWKSYEFDPLKTCILHSFRHFILTWEINEDIYSYDESMPQSV